MNGGPAEVGATTGVQWYGPIGSTPPPPSPSSASSASSQSASSATAPFPTIAWLRGATPVVTGEDAGGYPGQPGQASVPTHFLHATGGKVYSLEVSWEPAGPAEPGVYDARHLHLAIAEPSKDKTRQDDPKESKKGGQADASKGEVGSEDTAGETTAVVGINVMWATFNASGETVVEYSKVALAEEEAEAGGGSGSGDSGRRSTQTAEGRSYSFPMVAAKPNAPPGHNAPASPLLQWEHVVLLPGLEPGERYQYRPGEGPSGRDFANSSWRTFTAPHPAGTELAAAQATAFFVLADMGADESGEKTNPDKAINCPPAHPIKLSTDSEPWSRWRSDHSSDRSGAVVGCERII